MSRIARTRLAAGFAILLLGLPLRRWVLPDVPCYSYKGLQGFLAIVAVVLALPCLLVLWRLRRLDRDRLPLIARGINLALPWGVVNCLVAGGAAWATLNRSGRPGLTVDWDLRWDLAGWTVYAGAQAAFTLSAFQAVRTMSGVPPSWTRFFGHAAAKVGVYLLLVLVLTVGTWLMPAGIVEKQPGYEATAIGVLRALNAGEASYAAIYPDEGFASTLEELRAANAISERWAGSGNAVVLRLAGGARNASGKVVAYTATAAPWFRPRGICRSFFADETGTIRFTEEDRPPNANDPWIQ